VGVSTSPSTTPRLLYEDQEGFVDWEVGEGEWEWYRQQIIVRGLVF